MGDILNHNKVYKPNQIEEVLKLAVSDADLYGNNKGVYYYNVACAFDIETTSFFIDDNKKPIPYKVKKSREEKIKNYNPEKRSIMYVWQLSINGYIIIGREWKEFKNVLKNIARILNLNEKKRIRFYVHNLGYEFQFLARRFNWFKIFAIDTRKPIYAITDDHIEFRCSLLLSGYSLSNLSNNLKTYKIKKLDGDLDYYKMRHSKTPLTDKELQYCINDVKVVTAYIQEKIEEDGAITKIPLTKTSYVRKFCRKNCLYIQTDDGRKNNMNYKRLMGELKINNLNEFDLLQRAFQGGFAHSNPRHTRKRIKDVASYDFTSSYPYVMLSEKYPMSKGKKVKIVSEKQFKKLMNDYLCVFDVAFFDIIGSEVNENPLSESKCFKTKNVTANNGRVVNADMVMTSITNVDFSIFKKFYDWSKIKISNFYVYHKDYLPTPLAECIIELYEKKTTLKGIEGKELQYLKNKEMLNSVYGMSVTNPLRDEYNFNNEWKTHELTNKERSEELEKYNEKNNRFLFYPWGVFVTAYARRNLFTGIYETKSDYIYSDTDSLKLINEKEHKNYFKSYDKIVKMKLKKACDHHNIDYSRVKPKNSKGVEKMLGVWDYEGTYASFKTLGAKRYMTEEYNNDGEPIALKTDDKDYPVTLTVSGINKREAIPYLFKEFDGDINKIFEHFSEGMSIPVNKSGKLIHAYLDYEIEGKLTDYTGKKAEYHELNAVHLEPTGYYLSMAKLYADYLNNINERVL
jgi:hypothetical protein